MCTRCFCYLNIMLNGTSERANAERESDEKKLLLSIGQRVYVYIYVAFVLEFLFGFSVGTKY